MNSKGRPVVLIDLDGTLIDGEYKESVELGKIRSVIQAEERFSNMLIGLFSDTAAETLLGYHTRYGLNGPIIAERGAVRIYHTEIEPRVHNFSWWGTMFSSLRDSFVTALLSDVDLDPLVVIGDVNMLSQDEDLFPPGKTQGKTLVLINGLRQASLSFYVRKRDQGGRWVKDAERYQQVVEICRRVAKTVGPAFWPLRREDANESYGSYTMHHCDSTKPKALSWVKSAYPAPDHNIFMIGDSMSDYLESPDVVQLAVGNANPQYKEVCLAQGFRFKDASTAVAERLYTSGVLELLKKIGDL